RVCGKAAACLRFRSDAVRSAGPENSDMSRTYAVVWSENGSTASGRLDAFGDRFELDTRTQHVSIPFAEVEDASIERGRASRLRGLPVLQLGRIGRPPQ